MNLEVKKVKKIIEEKVSNVEEKQVEIWGAKIPGHEIGRWGMLIIFIIQLYLLLHFSSFVALVKKEGKPPDVPWIGAYLGWLPQSAFLLLGFLFPTIVLFLLMLNLVNYQTSIQGSTWILIGGLVVFLLSLSITVLTIKKVFHFWRVIRKV